MNPKDVNTGLLEKTGGQILVDCLAAHGVKRVSSVAGESYLAVLDALVDQKDIEVITCRQEGGAAFMAESWGKLTGEPGICFATRGPGACNASIGVHTAMQDSTPMILFMGQVRREEMGREAFQEISVPQVFGGLAKWATEILEAERIPEIIYRAFKTATSGRPGPVVIGLPEDMLREKASVTAPHPFKHIRPAVSPEEINQIKTLLQKASRPLAIVGGSGWSDEACQNFMRFASSCHLPVAASFRRQDIFSHDDNCYVGELGTGPNPALIEKVRQADLILAIGPRLSEITTQGYTLFDVPVPKQPLIHIHPAESELGKVYVPTLAINAHVADVANHLAGKGLSIDGRMWAGWRDELRSIYKEWTAIDTSTLPQWNGADVTAIFAHIRDTLPEDAIITTGAGNYTGWAQRYLRYGRPGRLLAPTSGAMGYAVPAAIGASIMHPERLAVGFTGDGDFMMTGQELATAMHHGAKPVIMIFNNGMYGTIRMHQERDYPGRVSGTSLTNPDFVKLAESYGAFTARVEHANDFAEIWQQAKEEEKLAVIEVVMDPLQITTRAVP